MYVRGPHTFTMNRLEEAGRQDELAQQNRASQQWNDLTLSVAQMASTVLIVVMAVVGIAIAIGALAFLGQVGYSKIITARTGDPVRLEIDWSNEDWRWYQIQRAKRLEMAERLVAKN